MRTPWFQRGFGWIVIVAVMASLGAAQLPPAPDSGGKAKPLPRLVVEQRTIDLGTVIEGNKATVSWALANQGTADLVIERTTAGCGCTVVKLADAEKVIPPNGMLTLKAEFDSTRRVGEQKKTVTVVSNDPAEPSLTLEFKAKIETLLEIQPEGALALQAVRRGEAAARTLDITRGQGRPPVELLSVQLQDGDHLSYKVEPLGSDAGGGHRLRFTVAEQIPLGRLTSSAKLKLKVGDVELERDIPIYADIVADLTCHPTVLNATAQKSGRGKRLAPVTVRSGDKVPFRLLSAAAGPLLEVTVEPGDRGAAAIEYTVSATLHDDAPPGPFAALLEMRTSSLEQPLLAVPVFGIVAQPIEVEPPIIVLRQDGTATGGLRRVQLRASPRTTLEITSIVSGNEAVSADINREATSRAGHVRVLDVRLNRQLPKGRHEIRLMLTTNVEGAERLEIPVVVEAPG